MFGRIFSSEAITRVLRDQQHPIRIDCGIWYASLHRIIPPQKFHDSALLVAVQVETNPK